MLRIFIGPERVDTIAGMPRKFITQEVKDQNRESQRRSRARRNELVNDLKKQVESYQRQGAAASLEMQKVAQAATFENQRLRDLLRMYGVSQDEIRRHISSPPASLPAASSSSPSTTGLHEPCVLKCKACGSTSVMLEKPPATPSARKTRDGLRSQQDTAADGPQPSPSVSSAAIQYPDMAQNIATHASPRANPTTRHDPKLSPETQHYGPHDFSKNAHHVDTMETSCDAAASILVDLHYNADPERARAALGCQGPNSCTVNNIKIFQLLDKFP
ncbi:hypothetical protein Trco_001791 [Trichoderma cornu-damae]|uniref:BZIP domain-containing protein n=1 Tax=Trichoderma cornu-damae TaxID=654480 RepID=A0A9P8QRK8_9HYPO|nr:hypothetical protein Trco_001791 [Trichoderma cornu-damae]